MARRGKLPTNPLERLATVAYARGKTDGLCLSIAIYNLITVPVVALAGDAVMAVLFFVVGVFTARAAWRARQEHKLGLENIRARHGP